MKLLLAILSLACLSASSQGKERPHVLFIAIDDLRPELGCYGSPIAKSPVLDKLAAEGLRFDRAYCQQAICSPSRASLMTGARPDTIGVIENTAYFRKLNPKIVTLPQHFIANGYEAVYCGKIYHGRMTDNEHSWSRKPAWNRVGLKRIQNPGGYAKVKNQALWKENGEKMRAKYGKVGSGGLIHGPAYEDADIPDHGYIDGFNTRLAIATLKDHLAKKKDQPLFLALGFTKPHLDFNAPKRYWNLYDPAAIKLAAQSGAPRNGAATGLHASFELRTRHGIPKTGPIGDQLARTLLHAYYACVSYVDAQIGLMIGALEEAGVRDNTIIIVWGDHGWHLGEMGIWGKATNYEIATRVPLIVWTPDMMARGKSTKALGAPVDVIADRQRKGEPEDFHAGGSDCSGIVWKIGAEVTNVKPGDEVVIHSGWWEPEDPWVKSGRDPMLADSVRIWGYQTNYGSYCQFARAQSHQCMTKPKHLSWEASASYLLCASTA